MWAHDGPTSATIRAVDWTGDVNWTLVLAPVLGLAGALVGGLVSPLLTARRAKQLWLLQQRADLYADLVRFTIDVQALIGHFTGHRQLDLAAIEASIETVKRLYPRLAVLASDRALKASEGLSTAYLALTDVAGAGASPRHEVADDDPLVIAVEDAARSVQEVCRRALVPRGLLGLGRG